MQENILAKQILFIIKNSFKCFTVLWCYAFLRFIMKVYDVFVLVIGKKYIRSREDEKKWNWNKRRMTCITLSTSICQPWRWSSVYEALWRTLLGRLRWSRQIKQICQTCQFKHILMEKNNFLAISSQLFFITFSKAWSMFYHKLA